MAPPHHGLLQRRVRISAGLGSGRTEIFCMSSSRWSVPAISPPVIEAIRAYGDHLIGQEATGADRHWSRLYNAWRWRDNPPGAEELQLALNKDQPFREACAELAGNRSLREFTPEQRRHDPNRLLRRARLYRNSSSKTNLKRCRRRSLN